MIRQLKKCLEVAVMVTVGSALPSCTERNPQPPLVSTPVPLETVVSAPTPPVPSQSEVNKKYNFGNRPRGGL